MIVICQTKYDDYVLDDENRQLYTCLCLVIIIGNLTTSGHQTYRSTTGCEFVTRTLNGTVDLRCCSRIADSSWNEKAGHHICLGWSRGGQRHPDNAAGSQQQRKLAL